jgi:hypothetical protein
VGLPMYGGQGSLLGDTLRTKAWPNQMIHMGELWRPLEKLTGPKLFLNARMKT